MNQYKLLKHRLLKSSTLLGSLVFLASSLECTAGNPGFLADNTAAQQLAAPLTSPAATPGNTVAPNSQAKTASSLTKHQLKKLRKLKAKKAKLHKKSHKKHHKKPKHSGHTATVGHAKAPLTGAVHKTTHQPSRSKPSSVGNQNSSSAVQNSGLQKLNQFLENPPNPNQKIPSLGTPSNSIPNVSP